MQNSDNEKGKVLDENVYKEPWYLKNITFIVIAVIAMVFPYISFLIIPLIIMKKSSFDRQREEMREHIRRACEEDLEGLRESVNSEVEEAKRRLARIEAEIEKKSFYYGEIERIKDEIEALEKKEAARKEKIIRLSAVQKSVNNAIKAYFNESSEPWDRQLVLPPELVREVESLLPDTSLHLHSMDYKDLRRAFNANEKLIDDTLARYEDRYNTKTNKAIYQLMVIALRAELQNILYTLTYSKLSEGTEAIKKLTSKYLNIARSGSQTISATIAKFIGEIEPLFLDAVKIEYEYYVKKEAARQEQMELREKMREEAEERKRLKEQQEQMEREESKYKSEIENMQEQIKLSDDEERNKQLLDKIKELESQLHSLSEKKEEIVNLQHGKAGYVYVISNLGSFGNDVFKIGMTRRLDPQERVDELGSASVPFRFDVHSFIFSDDAVKLESDLHDALSDKRLNKVNLRKEFFKVSIDELESLVDKFDPSAEFNRTMQAEQYYQSLSMDEESLEVAG